MKFGKTFTNHQIPEWSGYYINYKDLKKQIKFILQVSNHEQAEKDAAIAGFFFALDRNIEKVDEFYNRQYAENEKRFKRVSHIINESDSLQENGELHLNLDDEELEEVAAILLDLRAIFRNMKWFGELNKRGFVKILKKFDKKTVSNQKDAFLVTRIDPLLFANDHVIVDTLYKINEFLNYFSLKETQFQKPHGVTAIARPTNILTKSQIDTFSGFMDIDDQEGLFNFLNELFPNKTYPVKLIISLLNKAANKDSLKCVCKIISFCHQLSDPSDINGRNFFHHYIISLSKKQGISTNSPYKNKIDSPISSLIELRYSQKSPTFPASIDYTLSKKHKANESSTLGYILDILPEHLRTCLSQKDYQNKSPLHYACKYGFVEETKIIIEFLRRWKDWDGEIASDDVFSWDDSEIVTPLGLAILGKHLEVVKVLVENAKDRKLYDSRLLLLATRLNSPEVMEILLSKEGLDVNFEDDNGESLLFIASKMDHRESVKLLLKFGANTETKESSYGWTSIFIASIQGYKDIVTILKSAGARYDQTDESGWLPMEHACLRGHLEIADLLKPQDYEKTIVKPYLTSPRASPEGSQSNSNAVSSEELTVITDIPALKEQKAIKSFGHRFLKPSECMIIITLGSNDTRNEESGLKLEKVPISKIHSTKLDTSLSLMIHRKGAHSEDEAPTVIDLPVNETEPIIINCSSDDPSNEVIFFDIIPTYGDIQILGRGVASVKALISKVGLNRTVMNKACSISILELESLDVLGTVNFEILTVTAFEHPNMSPTRTETYWKSLITSRVIGHRGLGKNYNKSNSLQLGENTVESFIAAASLGASYVEFDVQLTKDSQPVIYHDFLVAESGADIPMHELTLEQFLNLGETSSSSKTSNSTEKPDDSANLRPKLRARASSHSAHLDRLSKDHETNRANLDKMKLTRTYKVNQGFKGNSRGLSIASSFVTLKDLFKKVPKNVGFNIECKYPLLYELQDEDLGEVFIELNHWVDTVLQTVFDYSEGRDVIFSSFHPETCMLLSLKQPSIPVLFLTEAGTAYMPDTRTDSLQSAIRFCKKWNLLGIVSESKPILKCPRLVSTIKQQGLVCFTYGSENNDPVNSKLQMNSGVDAVIVDSVLAVRKGLQSKDATTTMFTV